MTWEEFKIKYPDPEARYQMSEADHRQYVLDLYDTIESNEEFAKTFWTPFELDPEKEHPKFGTKIKSISRWPIDDPDFDMETYPWWRVELEDGCVFCAAAEEILLSERIANGCPEEYK